MSKGSSAEKVIFCDIGNVLVFFDIFKAINAYLALGRKPAKEVLPKIFNTAFIGDFETGKISAEEFHAAACELFEMKIGFGKFRAIWNDIFKENIALTRWLREMSASHRVYIISNTNALHYAHLRESFGFFRWVNGTVASNEAGLRKPDPRIFYQALRVAGVRPDQAFYLDDVGEHVHSARRCGMRAYLYVCPAMARESWKHFLSRPSIW